MASRPCNMIVLGSFTDYERFMRHYQLAVAPLITQMGGEYLLIRSGLQVLEGSFPAGGGAVVSRWPSRDAALQFWNSPDYAKIRALREGTGLSQVILVDG